MKEVFFLVEENIEGGYVAKALGESIYTQANNIEDLKNEIRDAVRCHFEDDEMPKIIRLHMVKEETMTL